MKRIIVVFIAILIAVSTIDGCSYIKKVNRNNTSEVTNGFEKLENQVGERYKTLERAVVEGDIETFLSFQDENNEVFYREQKRWIESVIFKRKQGFKYDVRLENIKLDSENLGRIDFIVEVEDTNNKKYLNKVTYRLVNEDGWKISDLDYERVEKGNITICYLEGQRDFAEKQVQNIKDILELYKNTFQWNPGKLTVKLYKSPEELAATIPWTSLAGWNEAGESIKVLAASAKDDTLLYLAHEIAHNMLSDLTNDNASLYLHEGLATLLEYSIIRDGEGKLRLDYSKSDVFAQNTVRTVKNRYITITEMSNLTYDQGHQIYFYGFLLTKYLVEEKGLDSYLDMVKGLKKHPYLNERSEQKVEYTNRYSEKELKWVYGDLDNLSLNYSKYYTK